MTDFGNVRIAAVQAHPVVLDAEATVAKAIGLLADAAADGARLVVFPECFVSLYPSGAWAAPAATWSDGCDELWERMWASSVDVGGPLVAELVDACAAHDVHLALGVNEREDARPGTLYNTLLVLGPDGVLLRHRKLMPTMHERVFHGVGAGDDLDVVALPGIGRVGGLICWENRMPLARWAVYEHGPQIWLAPNADDSDGWIASMRHVAIAPSW
jgi:nitrilase